MLNHRYYVLDNAGPGVFYIDLGMWGGAEMDFRSPGNIITTKGGIYLKPCAQIYAIENVRDIVFKEIMVINENIIDAIWAIDECWVNQEKLPLKSRTSISLHVLVSCFYSILTGLLDFSKNRCCFGIMSNNR